MTRVEGHPARLPVEELLKQCHIRHERRRGPGGQHRNKTESAVVIRHEPTGVEGQAAERRSQADNHRMAVKRLRINLAVEVRAATDAETAPSDLWRSRCRAGKIWCSAEHADFATLLAEALDVIAILHGHLDTSAAQLGCTPTQLAKFLSKEPLAFQQMNAVRLRHGLPPRLI